MTRTPSRIIRLAALVAVVAGIVPAAAQDDYPILVYPCPKLQPAPKIDGDLGDACWKQAPLASGFTWYNREELVDVQTALRVGYDEQCLYVAIRCDEPKMRLVKSVATPRDSKEVFRQEAIEMFVDPHHSHTHYYQLAFCSAGTFYDSVLQNTAWDSKTIAAAKELANEWTLEIAIPWADLKVKPAPGHVVGFNVCRDRHVSNARQWTNWAQTKANFHDPIRFAHLVLSGDAKSIGQMEAEFRKGERNGVIRVLGHEGYSNMAYAALAATAVADVDKLMADLAAVGQKEASAQCRREIDKRLAELKQRLEPCRQKLAAGAKLDALEWHRMGRELHRLKLDLGNLIWEARLKALLDSI